MMLIGGLPLIELVARRASHSRHEVIVATSVEQYDDRIVSHLQRAGVPVMRGDLDDVLGRFAAATADLSDDDRVVRLTGDNPMVDAALVDELIAALDAAGRSYGRVDIEAVPEGLGVEVFPAALLREADAKATDPYDREHVTPWIRRNCGGELLFAPAANPGRPAAYRATVDCLADYDRLCRVFDQVDEAVRAPWSDLMARLVAMVDADGEQVPRADGDPGMGRLILGSDLLGIHATASTIRDVFATAVRRGVTHAAFEPLRGSVVAQGTLPALRQRIRHISRIPSLPVLADQQSLSSLVEVVVERACAEIGQRRLDIVTMSETDDAVARSAVAWHTLTDYRVAGVIGRIGTTIRRPGDLQTAADLPHLELIVVPGDRLSALSSHLGQFLTRSDPPGPGCRCIVDDPVDVAQALRWPWVDAVIVYPRDAASWAAALDAACRETV